jgi:hypothetical protein
LFKRWSMVPKSIIDSRACGLALDFQTLSSLVSSLRVPPMPFCHRNGGMAGTGVAWHRLDKRHSTDETMPHHHPNNEDVSTIGPTSTGDDDQSHSYHISHSLPRIFDAGAELASLCRADVMSNDNKIPSMLGVPPSCLPIVRLLAGNHCCVDCGYGQSEGLNYASIGYGTILCQNCAHRHKTLSGEASFV